MVQNIVVPPFQPLCVTAGSLHWLLHVPLMQHVQTYWVDWVTESQQVWGLNLNWSTGISFHTNHCSAAILKQWWKLDWRKTVSLFQRRQRLTGSSCWCCSLGGPDCKLWYRHYEQPEEAADSKVLAASRHKTRTQRVIWPPDGDTFDSWLSDVPSQAR